VVCGSGDDDVTVKLRTATGILARAFFELVQELATKDPALGTILRTSNLRVAFDEREKVILISTVDDQGTATALVAIEADPLLDDRFGMVGTVTVAPASETVN
jgi:hypothetical protein